MRTRYDEWIKTWAAEKIWTVTDNSYFGLVISSGSGHILWDVKTKSAWLQWRWWGWGWHWRSTRPISAPPRPRVGTGWGRDTSDSSLRDFRESSSQDQMTHHSCVENASWRAGQRWQPRNMTPLNKDNNLLEILRIYCAILYKIVLLVGIWTHSFIRYNTLRNSMSCHPDKFSWEIFSFRFLFPCLNH